MALPSSLVRFNDFDFIIALALLAILSLLRTFSARLWGRLVLTAGKRSFNFLPDDGFCRLPILQTHRSCELGCTLNFILPIDFLFIAVSCPTENWTEGNLYTDSKLGMVIDSFMILSIKLFSPVDIFSFKYADMQSTALYPFSVRFSSTLSSPVSLI